MKRLLTHLAAMAAPLLLAATPGGAQQIPLQDKPFAEHKVVLQLSENDPKKAGLVISVAAADQYHVAAADLSYDFAVNSNRSVFYTLNNKLHIYYSFPEKGELPDR